MRELAPAAVYTGSTPYQDGAAAGTAIGMFIAIAAIISVGVWLVRSYRSPRPGSTGLSGAASDDVESLGRYIRLHVPFAEAAALVAHALDGDAAAAPTTGPTPAWLVRSDGFLVAALVPGDGYATLQIAEAELPLRSPWGARSWRWILTTVQQVAAGAYVQTTSGQRPMVPIRPVGPHSTIAGPAPF